VTESKRLRAKPQNKDLDILSANSRAAPVQPEVSQSIRTNFFRVRDHRAALAQAKKVALSVEHRLAASGALEYKMTAPARLQAAQDAAVQRRREEGLMAAAWGAKAMLALVAIVVRGREKKREHARYMRAIRRIQQGVRAYQLHKHNQKFMTILMKLSFAFGKYVAIWKRKRMNRKADIVTYFLRELGASAAVLLSLKRYHARIRKCQQIARKYIQRNRERYRVLESQWDVIDEARIHAFANTRVKEFQRVKLTLEPGLQLTGKRFDERKLMLRQLLHSAGPKVLQKVEKQISSSRNKYLESNLHDEFRELPRISRAKKLEVLHHYLVSTRKYFCTKFIKYKRDMEAWLVLQESQKSMRAVAEGLLQFTDKLPASILEQAKFSKVSMCSRNPKP